MLKKNIIPSKELLESEVPKLSKEQKIVQKALRVLDLIGEPTFSVKENRFKTNLKPRDEAGLHYARGLLEALLFNDDKD